MKRMMSNVLPLNTIGKYPQIN